MKHTSTVLEPSIPFHTLVKLVDAEDIANDKTRTQDLALELNTITNQLQTQTLDSSQQEQLMFTQPSYCHRTNHSISACFKKQRDDEDKREAYARSKSPQKSFVEYFRSPSNDRTKRHDARYRSTITSKTNYYNKNPNSQNRYRFTSRDRFSYDKNTTPPQNTRSRYDNYNEIPGPTVLLINLLTDLPIHMTLVIDIDHVLNEEITTIIQDIHLPIDHLPDHEILDILNHVHIQIQESNSIQYKQNTKQIQLFLKYTCMFQLKCYNTYKLVLFFIYTYTINSYPT